MDISPPEQKHTQPVPEHPQASTPDSSPQNIPRPPRSSGGPIIASSENSEKGSRVLRVILIIAILLLLAAGIGFVMWFYFQQQEDESPTPAEFVEEEVPETTPSPRLATLTPPEGWVEQPDILPVADVVYASPVQQHIDEERAMNPNINITSESVPGGVTLEEFVTVSRQSVIDSLEGYELIDDAPVTTAQGYSAHIIGGTFLQEGIVHRNKMLLVVSPDAEKVYVATGTALAEGWDEEGFNSMFDTALTSIILP